MIQTGEPQWFNVFGEEVDLDDIDRSYALNILCMALVSRGLHGHTDDEIRQDTLITKLREVVLDGRERTLRDRWRALKYNWRCWRADLPYRAPVR